MVCPAWFVYISMHGARKNIYLTHEKAALAGGCAQYKFPNMYNEKLGVLFKGIQCT